MTASEFRPMSIVPLGLTLSGFFVISFILCLLVALVLPEEGMRMMFEALFPGFVWLNPTSIVVGLLWSIFFGWYFALLFVPIRNYVYRRFA